MAAYVPLAADALAALAASDPVKAQQAVAKIVDLACDMKRYDYFRRCPATRRTWTSLLRSVPNCPPVPAR